MSDLNKIGSDSDFSCKSSTSSWSVVEDEALSTDDGFVFENDIPLEVSEPTITTIATIEQANNFKDVIDNSSHTSSNSTMIKVKNVEPKQITEPYEEFPNLEENETWDYDDYYDEKMDRILERKEKRKLKHKNKKRKSNFEALKLLGVIISIVGLTYGCFTFPVSPVRSSLQSIKHYGPENRRQDFSLIKTTPIKNTKLDDLFKETRLAASYFDKPKPHSHFPKTALLNNDFNEKLMMKNNTSDEKCIVSNETPRKRFLNDLLRLANKIKNKIPRLNLLKNYKEEGRTFSRIKLHILLALHLGNALLMLNFINKFIELRRRMLINKLKVKKYWKLLRLDKNKIPDGCQDVIVIYSKKSSKVTQLQKERKEKRHLFNELPFVNQRIPKAVNTILTAEPTVKRTSCILLRNFLQQLGRIEIRKQIELRRFSVSGQEKYEQNENEQMKSDQVCLREVVNFIENETYREELLSCLLYLRAKKRDYLMILKRTISTSYIQNRQTHFLRQHCTYLQEIIKLFRYKDDGKETNLPVFDSAKIIVDFIKNDIKKISRVTFRDATTERYVVPINSRPDVLEQAQCDDTRSYSPIHTVSKANCDDLVVKKPENKESSTENMRVSKPWKEKYDQLKSFWKSRQEYYEERLQICRTIKNIMENGDIKSVNNDDNGIKILDNIIQEVITRQASTRNSSENLDLLSDVAKDIKTVYVNLAERSDESKETCSFENKEVINIFERKKRHICDDEDCGCSKYPRVYWTEICKQKSEN